MTPHDLIARWMTSFEAPVKAAGRQFDKDMEAASLLLALDSAGFAIVKATNGEFGQQETKP